MTATLEQILADWSEDAQVLRRRGHRHDAELMEQFVHDIKRAAEPFLVWLSEKDAQIRSGRSLRWLRSQFPDWETEGHARRRNGRREYRMVVVPRRVKVTSLRADARRTARQEAVA